MDKYYKDVRAINLAGSTSRARAGTDIFFERVDNPPPDDSKVESLKNDYQETMFVLRNLDVDDATFASFYNQLIAGAQVSLKGNTDIPAGRSYLINIQRDMVRARRKARDRYLLSLLGLGFLVTLISLSITAIPYFIVPDWLKSDAQKASFGNFLTWLLPVMFLHPGVVLGIALTGFIANRSFGFDRISTFDPYYFSPVLRFFYVSIVSYALFVALWFNVFMLGAGGVLLNEVREKAEYALLIGFLCGFSEGVIVEVLQSRFKADVRE